ncbi:MAG: glycerophosphodiester phosphodiesterase family protein, partial [Microbacterium sp.]
FDATSPRVLAHRGLVSADDAEAVPNTFAAFATAHAAGAEYIESDCHLTSDGEIVLFHDATLTSITGDPRRVDEVTAKEMARQLADRGGLVTLAQALEAFPRVRFNIDVKADAAAEPAGRIIAEHAERVLLTSFSDTRRRAALRAAAPARPATSAGRETILRLVVAAALGLRSWTLRLLAEIDAIQIPERQGPIRVLTPRLIRYAHEAETEVHVWTVNDVARMRELVALGVDGIVTDRADAALDALRS